MGIWNEKAAEDFRVQLGERIGKRRRHLELSLAAVAVIVGRSERTAIDTEQGRRSIPLEELGGWSEALQVQFSWFLRGLD